MIETKGLLHIGMPVVSTKEAIDWYCKNMGFELAYETVYKGHEIAENVAFVRKDDVMWNICRCCKIRQRNRKGRWMPRASDALFYLPRSNPQEAFLRLIV